eukprot:CAMPEP_0117067890 /NCGR_PEP_ID=MMETSP0472-20121206/47542_1 /TAXON_ID=693140 ORGANISM="Tiarina fusus, Strain LIS" /NCGR_SAMPLE_ID=MMETSP0472 /ASSEMBLY_ACC=CAM_ASM_000603 /LENGTH=108 /DNA_ID=CAMNT_0004789655 /DNA_START=7 /DNA_END=329 /DNA_ORIENTATION=-
MACITPVLSARKLRRIVVIFLVIVVVTIAQDEQACSAEGVCVPAGGNGHQQAHQQQFQQQQFTDQPGQQQRQDSPHYIVETINIEFGEPQVVLNHGMDITRLNIQHTR